jgi:RNA polymerase sigma factor (TIGR02999 family)
MSAQPAIPLTQLLQAWSAGDGGAFDAVLRDSHAQLQRIAAERLRNGGPLTLTARDVLQEALVDMLENPLSLKDRAHFFATMSLKMRAVVIDHARARAADKRGGGALQVTLTDSAAGLEQDAFDLLALDEAMRNLATDDPRGSEILHLTYFAGLTQAEIAELMGLSLRTVEREVRFLRAWLHDTMRHG